MTSNLTDLASIFALNKYIDKRINKISLEKTEIYNSPKFNVNSSKKLNDKTNINKFSISNSKLISPRTNYNSNKNKNFTSLLSPRDKLIKNLTNLKVNNNFNAFNSPNSRNNTARKLNFNNENIKAYNIINKKTSNLNVINIDKNYIFDKNAKSGIIKNNANFESDKLENNLLTNNNFKNENKLIYSNYNRNIAKDSSYSCDNNVESQDIKNNAEIEHTNINDDNKSIKDKININNNENIVKTSFVKPVINFKYLFLIKENFMKIKRVIYQLNNNESKANNLLNYSLINNYFLEIYQSISYSEYFSNEFCSELKCSSKELYKIILKLIWIYLVICSYFSITNFERIHDNKKEFVTIELIVDILNQNYVYLMFIIMKVINFDYTINEDNKEDYEKLLNYCNDQSMWLKKKDVFKFFCINNNSLYNLTNNYISCKRKILSKSKNKLNSVTNKHFFKEIKLINLIYCFIKNIKAFNYDNAKLKINNILYEDFDNIKLIINSNLNDNKIDSQEDNNIINEELDTKSIDKYNYKKYRNVYLLLENVLVYIEEDDNQSKIHVRPNFDEFIKRLCNHYNIYIFSLYDQEIIDQIINNLNVKDLINEAKFTTNLEIDSFEINKTIIISSFNNYFEIDIPLNNTVLIEKYEGQQCDDQLIALCDDLQYLSDVDFKDIISYIPNIQKKIDRIIEDKTKGINLLRNISKM